MIKIREITYSKRVKRIYHITLKEFREGIWCCDKNIIPDNELLELEYIAKKNLLIVRYAEIKTEEERTIAVKA